MWHNMIPDQISAPLRIKTNFQENYNLLIKYPILLKYILSNLFYKQ